MARKSGKPIGNAALPKWVVDLAAPARWAIQIEDLRHRFLSAAAPITPVKIAGEKTEYGSLVAPIAILAERICKTAKTVAEPVVTRRGIYRAED